MSTSSSSEPASPASAPPGICRTAARRRATSILERRENLGGTWDLFKYPGIRSDSDMYTLGFRFKPWTSEQSIADGAVDPELSQGSGRRERHRQAHALRPQGGRRQLVRRRQPLDADASNRDGEAARDRPAPSCSAAPATTTTTRATRPSSPAPRTSQGTIVHPQHWPEDLDYQGKKIVVIGSGATAVTLIPALIDSGAGHVTMLQRSPTYIASHARQGPVRRAGQQAAAREGRLRGDPLEGHRAEHLAVPDRPEVPELLRARHCAPWPSAGCRRVTTVDKHFSPSYKPWDQRVCLAPNGDLFRAIRKGKADVVTDTIERFTETGIKLTSGEELRCRHHRHRNGFEHAAVRRRSKPTRNGEHDRPDIADDLQRA